LPSTLRRPPQPSLITLSLRRFSPSVYNLLFQKIPSLRGPPGLPSGPPLLHNLFRSIFSLCHFSIPPFLRIPHYFCPSSLQSPFSFFSLWIIKTLSSPPLKSTSFPSFLFIRKPPPSQRRFTQTQSFISDSSPTCKHLFQDHTPKNPKEKPTSPMDHPWANDLRQLPPFGTLAYDPT